MERKIKITILALLALTLTGCVSKDIKEGPGFDSWDNITTAEYNGHSYIIYKGYNKGGITHDPDCPCQEKDYHVKLD